uniref:Uncharacterized protein n=1 Tax=Cannabis sativa TaxID=3483 RepID=A0A803Q735_CANSA
MDHPSGSISFDNNLTPLELELKQILEGDMSDLQRGKMLLELDLNNPPVAFDYGRSHHANVHNHHHHHHHHFGRSHSVVPKDFEVIDDDVAIISSRIFAEAKNNPSRNLEVREVAEVGTEVNTSRAAASTSYPIQRNKRRRLLRNQAVLNWELYMNSEESPKVDQALEQSRALHEGLPHEGRALAFEELRVGFVMNSTESEEGNMSRNGTSLNLDLNNFPPSEEIQDQGNGHFQSQEQQAPTTNGVVVASTENVVILSPSKYREHMKFHNLVVGFIQMILDVSEWRLARTLKNSTKLRMFRARELEDMLRVLDEDGSELSPLDSEKLLEDCALDFQRRMEELGSEWSNVGFSTDKDIDECLEHLGKELSSVEAESTKISQEIEMLTRTHAEDYSRMEIELEGLKCSLDSAALQDLEKVKLATSEGHSTSMNVYGRKKLELLELENRIEKKTTILKTLEDLDSVCKWFDATEQVEDAFAGIKVTAFDENCIRLSLQTYIPKLESFLSQQNIEAVDVPLELKHQLMIEVVEGTMEPKNVEIFPNDIYINDILNAAKNFSQSSLQWFVSKVQDRIVLCTMRQLVVKSANKSRYSLEYLDKDEMILAHLVGGVDALIKVSQGWPESSSPLKLISLKSSNNDTKGISLSFLCKVKALELLKDSFRGSVGYITPAGTVVVDEAVEEEELHHKRQPPEEAEAEAVKQFHPDVNRTGQNSDAMIRRVIQAYEMLSNCSRLEIIESECLDPFEKPECEALDLFVNGTLCVGKGCPYSCVTRAPHAFTFASTGTATATSQGHGEDYQVQLAVGQCPRSCIHYVTPSQRIILEELLDSIMNMPYDCSAEADLLYGLIVKSKYENNRYQKPKKQAKVSTENVDWF